MEDLQTQIDDITGNIDDLSSSQDDLSSSVDDHENRLSDAESVTSQIDPNRINQLDYPLDQDSKDLINQAVQEVTLFGVVSLSSGTATITDSRITANSVIVVTSTLSHNGGVNNTIGASCFAGYATFSELTGTYSDPVNYVIYIK